LNQMQMAQIQIKWRNGKGKTINLKVELTDSIVEVKNRIMSQEGIPADQKLELFKKEGGFCWWTYQTLHQTLQWNEYEYTLEDWEIKEGSTIYMEIMDQSTFRIGNGEKVFGMKWVDVGKTKPQSLKEIRVETCPDAKMFFDKEMERNEREKDKAEGEKEDAETGKGKDFYKLPDDEWSYYWELSQSRKEKVEKLVEMLNKAAPERVIDLSYNQSDTYILDGEWLSQNDCIKAANGRYDHIFT